jgi:translocation protein SEC63
VTCCLGLNVAADDLSVIDERIVTPAAIVYLVVKLRLTPPNSSPAAEKEETPEVIKQRLREDEAKDYAFLTSKAETEEGFGDDAVGWAHAPRWPANRKPSWWLVLGDDKSNRIAVPPIKITDVPFSDPSKARNYRSYKLQFQAPQQIAMFTWKIYLVSDTFVGEEIEQNITVRTTLPCFWLLSGLNTPQLKIDDPAALTAEERGAEDEISDPEEDSLAGQMAALRGGAVKAAAADESDDESGTDDDEESGSGSSSDSDSD